MDFFKSINAVTLYFEKEQEKELEIELANNNEEGEHFHPPAETDHPMSLRIFGVAEKKRENTKRVALKIFRKNLGLTVCSKVIDKCFRIEMSNGTRPRAIVVSLLSSNVGNNILNNRHLLDGTGIVIFQELWMEKCKVYRKAAKKFGQDNVQMTDIGISVKFNDKTRCFVSCQHYENFIQSLPKSPKWWSFKKL